MFPHDASQESAAASRAVADAPLRGIRRVVRDSRMQRPVPSPAGALSCPALGMLPPGQRLSLSPRRFSHRVATRGPAVVAGPVIPS